MKGFKYTVLSQSDQTEAATTQTKQNKFLCNKVSRFKVLALVTILVVSIILIAFSCLKAGLFSQAAAFCNLTNNEDPSTIPKKTGKPRISFAHMKRRLPQCLVIGARKAGTRALLTYLNIHPDVVAKGEEMHFFEDDYFYSQSLEAYRKKMPPTYEGQITVEKTPAYFTSAEVPERVYRMNRTIRMLLLLRDPVERSISDYLQISVNMQSKNKPFGTFEQHALDKHGKINKSYKAISRSVYHRHLARWLEFFTLDQIHIIDSRELVYHPYHVMRGVEDFLGLEHKIKDSNFYFNKTKGFYCVKTDILQKCLAESKGRQHPDVDESVIKKLRQYFAPHNLKLYKMIGQSFNWPEE